MPVRLCCTDLGMRYGCRHPAAPACVIGTSPFAIRQSGIEYRDQVAATLAPFGGEVLFRGRKARVLGGAHDAELTVIRFPSLDAAHGGSIRRPISA